MLPKLEREEESSIDKEAFPEFKLLLMNGIPLSGICQTMDPEVEKKVGYSKCLLLVPTFP